MAGAVNLKKTQKTLRRSCSICRKRTVNVSGLGLFFRQKKEWYYIFKQSFGSSNRKIKLTDDEGTWNLGRGKGGTITQGFCSLYVSWDFWIHGRFCAQTFSPSSSHQFGKSSSVNSLWDVRVWSFSEGASSSLSSSVQWNFIHVMTRKCSLPLYLTAIVQCAPILCTSNAQRSHMWLHLMHICFDLTRTRSLDNPALVPL